MWWMRIVEAMATYHTNALPDAMPSAKIKSRYISGARGPLADVAKQWSSADSLASLPMPRYPWDLLNARLSSIQTRCDNFEVAMIWCYREVVMDDVRVSGEHVRFLGTDTGMVSLQDPIFVLARFAYLTRCRDRKGIEDFILMPYLRRMGGQIDDDAAITRFWWYLHLHHVTWYIYFHTQAKWHPEAQNKLFDRLHEDAIFFGQCNLDGGYPHLFEEAVSRQRSCMPFVTLAELELS